MNNSKDKKIEHIDIEHEQSIARDHMPCVGLSFTTQL
jgi:hypothetical protein